MGVSQIKCVICTLNCNLATFCLLVFWTGGRDVQSPQQFIWETTKSEMNNTLRWHSYGESLTCVYYIALKEIEWNGYIASWACSEYMYPLCQIA